MTDVLPDRAWGIVAVIVAIGLWIVLMKLFALVLEKDERDLSRMDSLTQPDRPQHAGNVVPIDGWRESKVIVSRSDLHRGFGG
jgi:hypothetical protein